MRARLALSILGCAAALACGDDTVHTAQAPASTRPTVAPAQAEDPLAALEGDFHYDPTGKPDPFRSFIQVAQVDDAVSTPLERFDLSQLAVEAIVWGTERPRALVKDPAGKGYIVSQGTPIGKNKGRVVSIEDNVVRVKETYVDFRDQATTKEVEMRLHATEGG
jgi:type IV pilus assembly protein PilP